ncbi:disease resistance protein RUN1-like [Juglans microcarpa x Juglans regia]|uniref:disease resistance protein RUN1-like n=1 Tax=Juglans microcarpa x Juglans regia TaxID=2249226 RepID=UPI001B7E4473|nr:disease resistance protein RUN1-like [Juglans microcarpa x Juglans regia]
MAFQLGASSSSSPSSIILRNYDVFLSFRGKDVRRKFISHLYQALLQNGIKTYKDNVDLKRGEQISSELFKAIEESRIAIIVFSENYAESKWCLDELLKILECKKLFNQIVVPVFYEIKPSDIREQKGSFGEAFTKLGKKIKDADIKQLESWKEALEEVVKLSGFEYTAIGRDDESEVIKNIVDWVNSRIKNQTRLYVAEYPIEIEPDIFQHLSVEKNDIRRMVGIFGTGGIGKTTFSKDIYNRISDQFKGRSFLSNIKERSKREGLDKLQEILLSEILGEKININDADRGVNMIRERLHSKKVLLVLDDVDELDQLKKLAGDRSWFGLGSIIIVTTRDRQVLNLFEDDDSKYELKHWDDNKALRLFSLHAFKKKEPLDEYMELSKRVIKYAQGLPLALTVLGSDLKGQSIPHWERALDKYKSIPHKDIQRVLQISYDGLEDKEKEMFLDIAFFFNGESLAEIKKIFESCDFFPDYGIDKLIKKCLINIEGEYVWMHNLLQDMGREIVRLESPLEPGERSRLWFHKDIREVLEESMVRVKKT